MIGFKKLIDLIIFVLGPYTITLIFDVILIRLVYNIVLGIMWLCS
jgi:hypothetical protein